MVGAWYDNGMTTHRKVAISIPDETYQALERARDKLGQSRSEAVSHALRDWLSGLDAGETRRRYLDGYRRLPEHVTAVDGAWAEAAVAGWSEWDVGAPPRVGEAAAVPAGTALTRSTRAPGTPSAARLTSRTTRPTRRRKP